MIGRTNAGGGASLNFKVVGGTTEPASSKENTIWVNTDAEITGWIFSASEPENPTEGMVLFPTGTDSNIAFNALKKNGIQVYPLSAKQYISGAWVDKTVKIYQGGAWVDWITYLYNLGNECIDLTGGWTISGYSASSGKTLRAATKAGSYIEFIGHATNQNALGTDIGVNVDGYNTLHVDAEVTGSTNSVSIHMNIKNDSKSGKVVASIDFGSTLGRKEWTVDLSSISGRIYLFCFAQFATSCKGRIYKVWLT